MKKHTLFLAAIVFVLASSCKKDPAPDPTTGEMGRDTLYAMMRDMYLWRSETDWSRVNRTDYDDPYKLLEALRYKPIDRFSFVADYDEFHAEFGGEFVGHGFRLGLDKNNKVRIAMIYNTAPLYLEGVRRGWIVKTINGADMADIFARNDGVAYNAAIGPNQAGITNTFVFIKPDDGTDVVITSTKTTFNIKSVIACDTLHLRNGIAGHLVLDSFIDNTQKELNDAFAFFKANNINNLILDLRYNPGGFVDQAVNLASYIGGNGLIGTSMATVDHNDVLKRLNYTFTFRPTAYSLDLPRLVVITSRGTASASEFVINGLKPHIEVVTLGDTTYGKPVGFYAYHTMKEYTLCPAAFRIVNSLGQGDYYTGMVPSKLIIDDITHDFTDREEANLKAAIFYLENGSLPSFRSMQEPFRNGPQFSERPEWMNNMFISEKPFKGLH